MKGIKVFCPATVANVSCGFDVLGFALESVGDHMQIHLTSEKGIRIRKIEGAKLPLDPLKNVAGVAALAITKAAKTNYGFEIDIEKRIKPGSGIGSSAASASGVVWAINELLGKPFSNLELVQFAMKGEKLASGAMHADNVAPALYGGFTLVRGYAPLDIISLPVPKSLYAVIAHPQVEIKTSEARKLLPKNIPLKSAVSQSGNLAGFVASLYTSDYNLMARSLQDHIAEPVRSPLIPHFTLAKKASLEAGALGFGISGSGPSVFALCNGKNSAEKVQKSLIEVYKNENLSCDVYLSLINTQGIKQL